MAARQSFAASRGGLLSSQEEKESPPCCLIECVGKAGWRPSIPPSLQVTLWSASSPLRDIWRKIAIKLEYPNRRSIFEARDQTNSAGSARMSIHSIQKHRPAKRRHHSTQKRAGQKRQQTVHKEKARRGRQKRISNRQKQRYKAAALVVCIRPAETENRKDRLMQK